MKHDKRVKFLEGWKKLFKHYNMGDTSTYGEPSRIIRAMEVREREVSYVWSGGACDERGSFDVTVKIPSESKFSFTSYEIHFKVFPEDVFLKIEQTSPCFCKDKRYNNSVSRFLLPCKHEIAGRMALERDLKSLLKEKVEKGKIDKKNLEMSIERFYVPQEDPRLWYVRWNYPKEIFEWKKFLDEKFKKLKRDRFFTALMKYNIFYYHLAKSLGENVSFYTEEELFY